MVCFCLSLWPMWQEILHLILEQYYFASRMLHMFWHCVWGCRIFSDHIIIVLAMTQTSFLSRHRNILVNKRHGTTWKLHMLLMKKLETQLGKNHFKRAWMLVNDVQGVQSQWAIQLNLYLAFSQHAPADVCMLPTLCPFISIRLNLSEEHGSQVFIGCC